MHRLEGAGDEIEERNAVATFSRQRTSSIAVRSPQPLAVPRAHQLGGSIVGDAQNFNPPTLFWVSASST
jgi:hypothetical protein